MFLPFDAGLVVQNLSSDAGLLELMIGTAMTAYAGVFAAKQRGILKPPVDKEMQATLTAATKSLVGIAAAMQDVSTEMKIVSRSTETTQENVSILRRQHGDEMPQGQFEAWKIEPPDRANWDKTAKKTHSTAALSNAVAGFLLAEDDDERAEARGALRTARSDWLSVRNETR